MDVTGPVGQRVVDMAGAAQQFPHIRRRQVWGQQNGMTVVDGCLVQ